MKLTITEIINKVKSLAHDQTLPTNLIYDFINQAIHDIEKEADYNFQVIRNEIVTVPANTKTITPAYEVKRIVEYSPPSLELQINQGNIELAVVPKEEINITLTYIRKIPKFDDDENNNIFPDSYVLITGAVYYALMYNNQPDFQFYQSMFYQRLKQFAEQNAFILPVPEVENVTALGI